MSHLDTLEGFKVALSRIEELEAKSGVFPGIVEDITQAVDLDATDFELSDEQKIDLQIALKEFGFYKDTIDGDIGSVSKRAIKLWQDDRAYTATCASNIKKCSAVLICSRAISKSSSRIIWNTKAYNFKHVTEAKRRGLTCGVAEPAVEPNEAVTLVAIDGRSIRSVLVQITKPTFDVYSCAFNLEFTNSTVGKSFDVVMLAEGRDGKFTASEKDIQSAMIDAGLTSEDNNWSQLSIKAKKYYDPSVVCQPSIQSSYLITEDGTEGTFKIDIDGQLTMTGLPIFNVIEN